LKDGRTARKKNKFDGADALRAALAEPSSRRERNAARDEAVERKRLRKSDDARQIMDRVRRAIERAPVEGLERFADLGVMDQARVATALVERLTEIEKFGFVESAFGVISWMSDVMDEAFDEDEKARLDADGGARMTNTAEKKRTRASDADEVDTGVLGAVSTFLRQWFSIDIEEIDPDTGRKQITVNASAEFLVVFTILLVLSAQFGHDVVVGLFGQPIDPLLR
jgi:hypothetical protein